MRARAKNLRHQDEISTENRKKNQIKAKTRKIIRPRRLSYMTVGSCNVLENAWQCLRTKQIGVSEQT